MTDLTDSYDYETTEAGPPGAYRVKSGGGLLSLFGAPFLLAGTIGLARAFGLIESHSFDGPWQASAGVGFLFTFIGVVFVFGRRGVTVDPARGKATRWSGLLLPMLSKNFRIEDFAAVTVDRRRASSGSDALVYVVRLDGAGGEGMEVSTHSESGPAVHEARLLARFSGLPLAGLAATDGVEDPLRYEDIRRAV